MRLVVSPDTGQGLQRGRIVQGKGNSSQCLVLQASS
jgi:hypothetical protein